MHLTLYTEKTASYQMQVKLSRLLVDAIENASGIRTELCAMCGGKLRQCGVHTRKT